MGRGNYMVLRPQVTENGVFYYPAHYSGQSSAAAGVPPAPYFPGYWPAGTALGVPNFGQHQQFWTDAAQPSAGESSESQGLDVQTIAACTTLMRFTKGPATGRLGSPAGTPTAAASTSLSMGSMSSMGSM